VAETSTPVVLVGNIVFCCLVCSTIVEVEVFYFFCLVGLQDYKTQPLQPLQSNLSLRSGLCATKPDTSRVSCTT
jgi:hypothetical protein